MKTKEFKEKIETLEYYVYATTDWFSVKRKIYDSIMDDDLIYINCYNECYIEINYSGFRKLDIDKRKELLDIAVEYSSTPIEERDKEDLYYLKTSKENLSRYLNYESLTGEYYLDSEISDEYRQTKFTFDEIDNLPQIYQDLMFLEVLEIVEVEEE